MNDRYDITVHRGSMMTEMHYKEVTVRMGFWENTEGYNLPDDHWVDLILRLQVGAAVSVSSAVEGPYQIGGWE